MTRYQGSDLRLGSVSVVRFQVVLYRSEKKLQLWNHRIDLRKVTFCQLENLMEQEKDLQLCESK